MKLVVITSFQILLVGGFHVCIQYFLSVHPPWVSTMTLTHALRQNLLLDLFSTHRHLGDEVLVSLNRRDQEALLNLATEHRMLPMLYWRLQHERKSIDVPDWIQKKLQNQFRKQNVLALKWQHELFHIHHIFKQSNIPYLALKGAYLAVHAYPQPGLRPLRDLDILVHKEQVFFAYQKLLSEGLNPLVTLGHDLTAVAQARHHLPPLQSQQGIHVELHLRLHSPVKNPGVADLAESEGLWRRSIYPTTATVPIPYMSPTDLVLHMIVHGTFDHKFDNGPLLLSDLAYLLQTHTINWPLFWSLAESTHTTSGCILALHMLEYYFGKQDISWPRPVGYKPAALVEHTAALMLRDFRRRMDVNLASDAAKAGSAFNRLRFYFSRFFTAKTVVATEFHIPTNSPWIYFYYLKRWRRQLISRLPNYLFVVRKRRLRTEIQNMEALSDYLFDQGK